MKELRLNGSEITVREPRVGVRFALRDDLRGLLDFFLGKSGMGSVRATAAEARAWTCDSDKLGDNMTTGFCQGTNRVSSLKPVLAGLESAVQVDGWQESAGRGHTVEERANWPIRTVMSGKDQILWAGLARMRCAGNRQLLGAR